jgi:hypothetical protein
LGGVRDGYDLRRQQTFSQQGFGLRLYHLIPGIGSETPRAFQVEQIIIPPKAYGTDLNTQALAQKIQHPFQEVGNMEGGGQSPGCFIEDGKLRGPSS